MRISGLLAVMIPFAGCAPTTSTPSERVAPPTRVAETSEAGEYSGVIYVAPDTRATVSEFGASADAVWYAAIDAYLALGIETVILESAALVGNPRFEVIRRLGGERLSEFVRCGTDDTGMPAANSYRVRMDVQSRVTPVSGTRTRLETTVVATARDVSGTAADRVQCASTGRLEARIAALAGARLREGG